jgi:trk system potassium uptake protein TrkH
MARSFLPGKAEGPMRHLRNGFSKITSSQLLVGGYILVTLAGAIILSLPISSRDGYHQSFIDSLFVATSGISTTGLTPVSIGSHYNLFGQIVLLCIFQIGGIGYMTIVVFLVYILGIKLPLTARVTAKESLVGSNLRMLEKFFIIVLVFTFLFELIGAVVLTVFWSKEFPLEKAIYLGVFHSISAFCTAGFSVFPDSMMKYRDSVVVNFTIIIISVVGGLGFFVLYDLCVYIRKVVRKQYPLRMSSHSKLALTVTVFVMLCATAIILLAEKWPKGMTWRQRLMTAGFQSVSASTTDGFSTIDIGLMSMTSLLILMALMFIGASPGSTGGGIKTTTAGLIVAFLLVQLKGKETHVNVFERQIPVETICRAFGVLGWFIIIALVDGIVLSITEHSSFLRFFFEAISALGNTGLSTGITSQLSFAGKIMLIITMFIGRIGPLTAGLFLVGRQKRVLYEYATEDVFVG